MIASRLGGRALALALSTACLTGLLALPLVAAGGAGAGEARFVTFSAGRRLSSSLPLPQHERLGQLQGIAPAFEVNRGQTDRRVRFLARGAGYTAFLLDSGAVLGHVALHFLNADVHPEILGLDRLPGTVNYFIGDNPRRWHTDVPTYARVEYCDVYPGINLIYDGSRGHLAYNWILQPGADPRRIRLRIEGLPVGSPSMGALAPGRPLRIDARGNLIIRSRAGEILQARPLIYQQIGGRRRLIPGHYVLLGAQQVGLAVGAYDPSKPLTIDPVLEYSTYLGGSGDDQAISVAVDASSDAYLTGVTNSPDFPTASALQGSYRGSGLFDAFVAKLNPTGTALVYSTYLGGSSSNSGNGVAVDHAGSAYVAGSTSSSDFPLVNALQAKLGGGACNFGAGTVPCRDAFVAKLSAQGDALLYSTYLGGNGDDVANAVAVDAAGSAYVAGQTQSSDFPTVHAVQATFGGGTCNYPFGRLPCHDAFIAKLSPTGNALVYSTYLGGNGDDGSTAIAVDSAGNAYLTGLTNSANFPTAAALQAKPGGGLCSYAFYAPGNVPCYDAFVTKLSANGDRLLYSTYLGGSGTEFGWGIAVDGSGSAYVTGQTNSTDFPTAHALQASPGGGSCGSGVTMAPCNDAFVAKLNPAGSALVYSTYLGGSGDDEGRGIAVDDSGNVYVTGATASTNFPTARALQPAFGGGANDAFVAKLNATGTALTYSTYLGGRFNDEGLAIAVDSAGDAYICGITTSGDFPTTAGLQPAPGGRADAFVARISDAPVNEVTPTASPIEMQLPTSTPVGTSTVTPSPLPTPTMPVGVSVISIRVEKPYSKPDWDLSRPFPSSVRAGATVRLSIYYIIGKAAPREPVTADWTIKTKRRVAWRRHTTHALGHATSGMYWDHTLFTPSRPGTYSYIGGVTFMGESDAGILSIRVR